MTPSSLGLLSEACFPSWSLRCCAPLRSCTICRRHLGSGFGFAFVVCRRRDVGEQINAKLRLPIPLSPDNVRLVFREGMAEVDAEERVQLAAAADSRRYAAMIKSVGWHVAEVTTNTASGDEIVALVEVQVISSSA